MIESNPFRVEIVPPAGVMPAWMDGYAALERISIPNTLMTSTGSGTGITSYSGATMRGTRMMVFGGGHTDYTGNEVIEIELNVAAPAWARIGEPTPVELREMNIPYQVDDKPSSRHTYWSMHWIERHNRLFLSGGIGSFNQIDGSSSLAAAQATSRAMDGFNPDNGQWDGPIRWDYATKTWDYTMTPVWPDVLDVNSGKGSVVAGEHLWEFSGSTGRLYRCDLPTMAWTDCGALLGSHYASVPILYDPARNRLIRPRGGPSNLAPRWYNLNGYVSGMPSSTTFSFSGASQPSWGSSTMTYCDYLAALGKDAYLVVQHQDSLMRMWAVDPDTFEVHLLTLTGTQPDWPAGGGARQNYYGRFAYVPALKGVVWAYAADRNVQFIKTE